MNPLLLIIGLAAIIYVPTLIQVLNLDIRITQVIPTLIQSDSIKLNASVQFTNKVNRRIFLNKLVADVTLNGIVIGTVTQVLGIPLLGKRQQIVGTELILTPSALGQQLWTDAINNNLKNFVVEFNGTLTADGKPYPFFTTWTITDFVNS